MSAAPSPLVRSGLTELATSAALGWVYALCTTQPATAKRIGIRAIPRVRQLHLDLAMLGTASVACGLAVPDAPRSVSRSLRTGVWTNALAFGPLAVRPEWKDHPAYQAAALCSFVATTYGFIGTAVAARRPAATAT